MSDVTGAVAELLGEHFFLGGRLRHEDTRQVVRCGCGWEGQGFDEHVAATLLASGLLVSTAEVREQVEALAQHHEEIVRWCHSSQNPRPGRLVAAACHGQIVHSLRVLLARLAGGTDTTEAGVKIVCRVCGSIVTDLARGCDRPHPAGGAGEADAAAQDDDPDYWYGCSRPRPHTWHSFRDGAGRGRECGIGRFDLRPGKWQEAHDAEEAAAGASEAGGGQ